VNKTRVLFLKLFAIPVQRNDTAILSHSFGGEENIHPAHAWLHDLMQKIWNRPLGLFARIQGGLFTSSTTGLYPRPYQATRSFTRNPIFRFFASGKPLVSIDK
jgi:hypothetical protein